MTFGGGTNADGVDVEKNARLAAPLHQHGQPPVAFRARCGNDALGDLALEHEDGGVVPGRPRLDADPGDEQSGGDVVGQVGDDAYRAAIEARARVEGERVRRDDVEAAGIAFGDLLQCRNARASSRSTAITRAAPSAKQRAGEAARPGADFQYRHACQRSRRACDARGEIEIEKEILSERFSGDETMAANDVAQRRQPVRRGGHDAGSGAGLSAMASRAASRSAATRLVAIGERRCRRCRRRCRDRATCARKEGRA